MTRKATDPTKGLGWGVFLAGTVPGLLQYRLGQPRNALLAALSCTALFFAGWALVGHRLFYWGLVAPEDSTSLAQYLARYGALVLPEVLNLPANTLGAVLAFDGSASGLREERLLGAGEHIGGWLTAASGMLAAFWAAQAHWELRLRRDARPVDGQPLPKPIAHPALCAALSWLVPGLGHAKAGQKDKGVLMGIAVLAVFAIGLVVSGGRAVDRADNAVWWIGQNLFGGGSLFASLVTAPIRGEGVPIDLDLGVVLCTVAGLMNLVVMVDAFTVAERSVFPVATPADVAGPEGGGEVSA
ncbi:MAG: hypothetical protein H6835_08335 [Planctomycetes bacterium]|nr:hypothetical protein [Planctomycetota bacterium]